MTGKQRKIVQLLTENKEFAEKIGFIEDDKVVFEEHPIENYKETSIKCKNPITWQEGEDTYTMEYAIHYINKHTMAISMFKDFHWSTVRFDSRDIIEALDLMITPYIKLETNTTK